MAIEDEIINISDIDIGTEILNSDKLLIETSSGTKMIAFKDFVVGPDNISSVRQSQIEGSDGSTAEATTFYDVVTGFNILNTQTSPCLDTHYNHISGTAELGVFNYNAIANLASVSADIGSNTSAIRELYKNLDHLSSILEANDFSITLGTSACNCIVTGATGGSKGGSNKSISFSTKVLDPATTNVNSSVELSPFKLNFPTDTNGGYVDGSRFMFVCQFDIKASDVHREEVTIYREKANGSSEVITRGTGPRGLGSEALGSGSSKYFSLQWTDVVTINIGDKITATANNEVFRGKLDIFKIS